MRRAGGLAVVVLGALCAAHAPLGAQELRGRLSATARYLELRPLRQDTVAESSVTIGADGSTTFDGRPVFCSAGTCTYYVSDERLDALASTQDLDLTVWGLPVRGLSVVALGRFRQDLGGPLTVPRSDDAFDLILGYVELARSDFRLRAGRLRTLSTLGFSGYDGAELRVDPMRGLWLTGYAGRSLARGLEEPRDRALAAVESFVPDRSAWLLGAAASVEPRAGTTVEARYERDIESDRSVLLGERAALSASTDVAGPVRLSGAADWDFAFGRVGKASLTALLPLADGAVTVEAAARRYVPYFELWTVWGFFSPVAYREGEAGATTRFGRVTARGVVAYRRYGDAATAVVFKPLEDDAWRAELSLATRLAAVDLAGAYQLERGFGATRSGGQASVGWSPLPALRLGARASATQQILEFRLGEQMLYGAGLEGRWAPIDERWSLAGGAAFYGHGWDGTAVEVDWSQRRGWVALEIGFGSDPRPTAPPIELEGRW